MSEIIDISTLFGPAPAAASDLSVDDLAEMMARHGVAACCTLSTLGILLDPVAGNAATRAAAAEDTRLVPAATYNPLMYFGHDSPAIHPRADGFRLARFFPARQGWPPHFAPFGSILRRLEADGSPAMVDIGGPGMATALMASAGSTPVPIILGGVGEPGLSEALSVLHSHDNVLLETSRLLAIGAIELAVRSVGADRVLFGSGAPTRPMASALAAIQHADIPDRDRELILGENAWRILGL